MIDHARLHVAANKYLLPGLETSALVAFTRSLGRTHTAADLCTAAVVIYHKLDDLPLLKERVVKHLAGGVEFLMGEECFV